MKKQDFKRVFVIPFIVASIMTFMCSLAAFGVGNLSLDKTSYLAGESMKVTVTGLTDDQIHNQDAWVALFKPNTSSDHYLSSAVDVSGSEFDSGTWVTTAPTDLGDYEYRLYIQVDGKDTLLATKPFKVESRKANSGDVVLKKDFLTVNEQTTITIKGLSDSQVDDGAWAGLYLAGDPNNKYIDSKSVNDMDKDSQTIARTWNFNAPKDFGNYEVRIFTKNGSGDEELQKVLYDKKAFTVGSLQAKSGDVTLSKAEFLTGDMATITFKADALTSEQIDDGAWFAMYNANDALNVKPVGDSVFVSDIKNNNFKIDMEVPKDLGSYELRVYTKNVPFENLELLKLCKFTAVPFKVVTRKSNDKNDVKTKNSVMTDSQKFGMGEAVVVVVKTYKTQADSEAAYNNGKSGGISPGQVKNGAWVGLYKLGDNSAANPLNSVYLDDKGDIRRTTSDGSKIWDFQAPSEPGEYIIKVFTQNTDADKRDSVLFAQIPITVTNVTKITTNNGAFDWTNYTLSVVPSPISTKVKGKVTLNVIAKPKSGSDAAPLEVNNLVMFAIKDTKIAKVAVNAQGKGVITGVKKGKTKLTLTVKGTWRLVCNFDVTVK